MTKRTRLDRNAAWHATLEIGLIVLAVVALPSVAWLAPKAIALGAGVAAVVAFIAWGWMLSYRQKQRENERRVKYDD